MADIFVWGEITSGGTFSWIKNSVTAYTDYIESFLKSAAKNIGSLCRAKQIFSPKSMLHIYKFVRYLSIVAPMNDYGWTLLVYI